MSSTENENNQPKSLLTAWMESAAQFWGPTGPAWTSASPGQPEVSGVSANDAMDRLSKTLQTSTKICETMISSLSRPEFNEAFIKGTGVLPEVTLKIMRTGWDGYFHLCRQWLRKMESAEEPASTYSFENLDQDMFKTWLEFYGKDIQPLLNVPQLGLARFYQERINQTADKFNLHQAAMSEFLHMLSLPVEKSLRAMEEKLQVMLEKGEVFDNFKDYYALWIKLLEGHYMTLFKSPEYLTSLSRMLATGQDFKMVQRSMIEDSLQSLPIPTNRDMDELYKEIYLLKKQVKELLKRLENLGPEESQGPGTLNQPHRSPLP